MATFPSTICPQSLTVTDRTFGYRSEFESGHVLSRARTTRAIKIFEASFNSLSQAQYLKLVELHRTYGNHTAFTFEWPLSSMYLDAQSTCTAGFTNTTFNVRFVEPDFVGDYNVDLARWSAKLVMEEV